MKSIKLSSSAHLLRLEMGEDIRGTILKFAGHAGISAATITGLGAVHNPELGIYNLENKSYDQKTLQGYFEITSFTGNIALVDDEPFLHAHLTVSDNQMQAFGGHFIDGSCGATLELTIVTYQSKLHRVLDEKIGLPLLEN